MPPVPNLSTLKPRFPATGLTPYSTFRVQTDELSRPIISKHPVQVDLMTVDLKVREDEMALLEFNGHMSGARGYNRLFADRTDVQADIHQVWSEYIASMWPIEWLQTPYFLTNHEDTDQIDLTDERFRFLFKLATNKVPYHEHVFRLVNVDSPKLPSNFQSMQRIFYEIFLQPQSTVNVGNAEHLLQYARSLFPDQLTEQIFLTSIEKSAGSLIELASRMFIAGAGYFSKSSRNESSNNDTNITPAEVSAIVCSAFAPMPTSPMHPAINSLTDPFTKSKMRQAARMFNLEGSITPPPTTQVLLDNFCGKKSSKRIQELWRNLGNPSRVLLKPAVGCCGNGIYPIENKTMHEDFHFLLNPEWQPSNKDTEISQRIGIPLEEAAALRASDYSSRYLLQAYFPSDPVQSPTSCNLYDGTVRLFFSLVRRGDSVDFVPFDTYWKLPVDSIDKPGRSSLMSNVHEGERSLPTDEHTHRRVVKGMSLLLQQMYPRMLWPN